jgi:hypothetical protein
MTRNEILREQAALRRMNKESKQSAFDAFKPENMFGTITEDEEDWGDVLINARGENNGWD